MSAEMQTKRQDLAPAGGTRAILISAVVLATLSTVLLLCFAAAYLRYAPAFLVRLDRGVGEVLMEEGRRLEDAGDRSGAKERYRAALNARFAGAQNRAHTLKRLGTLLWIEEDPEEALPYLEEAAAHPRAPITVYAPLCTILLGEERYEEAQSYVGQWLALAPEETHRAARAGAFNIAGRIARGQEDWDTAVEQFEAGDSLVPGGINASELASLHYGAGRYREALPYLVAYLASGATGGRADYARQMLAAVRERLGQTDGQ